MLKQCITSKKVQEPAEAAAPSQGAAAFFCSTKKRLLPVEIRKSTVFKRQAQGAERIGFYNLLGRKHYFRLNRAEAPLASVVLIEGQKRPRATLREVAA